MSAFKNPRNYWTYENTVNSLKQFIEGDTYFKKNPSISAIHKHDSSLVRAIYKFGGLRKLNEEINLGLTVKHRSWSRDDVLTELTTLYLKGIAITQKSLIDIDRQDILGAVYKYGSLNDFKSILGLPIKRHKYWSDEKIANELNPIVDRFGRIPTQEIFRYIGRSDLGRVVKKKGIKKLFFYIYFIKR